MMGEPVKKKAVIGEMTAIRIPLHNPAPNAAMIKTEFTMGPVI